MQYVRPQLEFASPAWAPWMEGDKESLEKVQRRALNDLRFEISAIRGEAERTRTVLTGGEETPAGHDSDFQNLKGVDNVNKSTWFIPASEGQARVTRMGADPLNVRQQASRLDIRKQFYSQRVVDAWIKVPTDIKNSVTVSSFKMAYKKHRGELEATT
jgi:hypothetical protein